MDDKEIQELSEKILQGMRIASRRLIEAKAASGKYLVIGDKNGKFKRVPAKDLLHLVHQA